MQPLNKPLTGNGLALLHDDIQHPEGLPSGGAVWTDCVADATARGQQEASA